MNTRLSTCVLCPRLCRTSCPVATGSAREAAVPTLIATAVREWRHGRLARASAVQAVTLCTDCGACQERCHIDEELPAKLRAIRAELLPTPPVDPLSPIEGEGEIVAIEADERPLAAAVAERLGQPVRRWVTTDRLGIEAVEHPSWDKVAARIRGHAGSLRIVVVDGGVAHALTAANVGFQWLHDLLPDLPRGVGSCRTNGARPLACCGGAGPLPLHHPEDADRVGRLFYERADDRFVVDGRCRNHLRGCGGQVSDPLDALLEEG